MNSIDCTMFTLCDSLQSDEPSVAANSPNLALHFAAELIRFIRPNKEEVLDKVITLDAGVRLERWLDPTHVNTLDALRTIHPHGSELVTNRWSGSFMELLGFGGAYFGFAPLQEAKHAAALSVLNLGLFGMEAELNYYLRRGGADGAASKIEVGVQRHGKKLLSNGDINPVLGLSGSYVVRYAIAAPTRLMHIDLNSGFFTCMFETICKRPRMKELLPANVSIETLLLGEETRYTRLLCMALAAALHHRSDFLRIDGVVANSVRAKVAPGKRTAKVICIWGKDGAVLRQLRPVSVSYFEFNGERPNEKQTRVEDIVNYAILRATANR